MSSELLFIPDMIGNLSPWKGELFYADFEKRLFLHEKVLKIKFSHVNFDVFEILTV